MKEITLNGKQVVVYRAEDELQEARNARHAGQNVMAARRCPLCGDYLLGTYLDENIRPPVCEVGHCGSRPGVSY